LQNYHYSQELSRVLTNAIEVSVDQPSAEGAPLFASKDAGIVFVGLQLPEDVMGLRVE
jgi:hypothetical protein